MTHTIPYRLLALEEARKEIGVREAGANNRGPRVEWYQTFDSLAGEGYAWCASFVNAMFVKAGRTLHELKVSPSVWWLEDYARKLGWIVSDPRPGDLVIFKFSHIGFVDEVRAGGLITIEGNTGASGSVSDSKTGGDGVYRKARSNGGVKCFIRVPGEVYKAPTLYPASVLRTRKGYYAWAAWKLGEGDWKGYGKKHAPARPAVPVRIPANWHARLVIQLAKRKVIRP